MRHNTGNIGGKYLVKQIQEGNIWQNKYRRGKFGKKYRIEKFDKTNKGGKYFVKQIWE